MYRVPLVLVLFNALGSALLDEWEGNIAFLLYTRKGQVNLTDSNIGELDLKKPTKFIFHGFLSNGFAENFQMIKDEYLRKLDCNMIIGDWSHDAQGMYIDTVERMTNNGVRVAEFLIELHKRGLELSNVHLIGHSLGAQMAGVAGREVASLVGTKIERITALDAARPLFEGPTSFLNKCINKEDAKIVDAIHTDAGSFGVLERIGTVDFYPFGGTSYQPGCPNTRDLPIWTVLNMVGAIGCSHSKSQLYLALTINNHTITGYKCKSWNDFNSDKCKSNMEVNMGEGYVYSKEATGAVYLTI